MEQIRTKIQKRDFRGKVRHGAEWLQLWANPHDDLSTLEQAKQRQSRSRFEQQRQSIEKLAMPLSGVEGFKHNLSEAQEDWNAVEWSIARGRLARAAFDRRYDSQTAEERSDLLARLAQARATALGLRRFPGLFEDFQRLSLRELEEAGCAHAFLAAQLPLERAILLVFVDRWSAQTQALWDSGAVDMWAAWFSRKCPRSLPLLDRSLEDPQAFRAACLAFLDELAFSLSNPSRQPAAPDQGEEGQQDGDPEDGSDDAALAQFVREALTPENSAENAAEDSPADPASASPITPELAPFTTDYDQTLPLASLVSEESLEKQRTRLHAKYGAQRIEARRLSRALAMTLRSRRQSDWQFDQEEGLIDASRLAQIVAAPHRKRTFKQEFQSQDLDAAVTLLLDCSGSMRGKWMDLTVLATQALGDALSLAGVPFEVLGYTTGSTNGGQSFKAWKAAGAPKPEAGSAWRLNDLRHYVLKDFAQPWRRPRLSLPGLCDPSLLRENIDHESLAWALQRLRSYPTTRRVMIVLTDGAPSCSTTERYLSSTALHQALRKEISGAGDVEICALGLRHRAEDFFRNSRIVSSENELNRSLFELVGTQILSG